VSSDCETWVRVESFKLFVKRRMAVDNLDDGWAACWVVWTTSQTMSEYCKHVYLQVGKERGGK
jgi:hypothetical protein